MFGVFQRGPRRPIDSFVVADERVIWVDRFNPTRPRREKVARWPYIRKNAYGTFSLVVMAIGAVVLAFDPTFVRQMLPEWKHHQLIMVLVALVLCPVALWVIRDDWIMLRYGEEMPFSFLLTQTRLLGLSKYASKPESVPLSRIVSVELEGSDFVLTLTDPDDEARLWDPADPDAALRAFQRSLDAFVAD